MNLGRALSVNMALVTVGRVLTIVLSLVTLMALTRGLEPSGFGQYRSVIAYLGFAGIVSYLGLHLIFVREFSREGADQGHLLGEAVGLRLASAALILVAATGLAWLFPYDPIVRWGILLTAPAFVAVAAHQLLTGVFQEKLRQGPPVAAEVAGGVLTLGLVLLLLQAGLGVIPVLGAYLAGTLLTLAISWWSAHRLVPFRPRADLAAWKALLVPALPIAGAQLLQQSYYKTDVIALSLLRPAAEVGLYAVGRQILDTFVGFALLYAGLIMPLLSRHAGKDDVAFARHLREGFDLLAVGFVGAAALTFAYAAPIAALLGGTSFAGAGPALQALSPLVALYPLSLICRMAVTALDRQRDLLPGYGAAAALALAGFAVLVPWLGPVGAAVGLLLGEAVTFAVALRTLHRAAGVLPSWVVPAKAMGAAALAYLLARSPWMAALPWLAGATLTGLAYLALLAAAGAIPAQIRAMLPLPARAGSPP